MNNVPDGITEAHWNEGLWFTFGELEVFYTRNKLLRSEPKKLEHLLFGCPLSILETSFNCHFG